MQERKAFAGGDITRTRHTFEANPTVFSGRDDTIVPIDKRFGESPSRLQLLSDFPEVSIIIMSLLSSEKVRTEAGSLDGEDSGHDSVDALDDRERINHLETAVAWIRGEVVSGA